MASSLLDEAKLSKFHIRTAIAGSAGQFCDGFVLGIIAPALPLFAASREVSPLMSGLLGASALIGLFVGASFFGWLTDKIGRKKLFIADMVAIALLSLAQLGVESAAALFVIRLLLGIAVGADYAVGPTVIAEFSPKKYRAALLASGPAIWTVGYVASFILGSAMADTSPDSWRWMLVAGAIPAVLLVFLRLGIPESPRWLIEKGRFDEALAVIRKHIEPNATMADVVTAGSTGRTNGTEGSPLRLLLQPFHRRRLGFVCLFWFCQVVPYFAVFTFLPSILESLSTGPSFVQTLTVDIFLLIGGALGVYAITRVGRRPYATISFSVLVLSTAGLGIWANAPLWYVVACFALFALVSSAMSSLDIVYPTELFPTEIRGTAMGIAVAFSRIGAAVGTFLLPIGMDSWGVHTVTLITAAIAGIGLIACVLWAPETRGLALTAAAGGHDALTPDDDRDLEKIPA
ncbi:MFS transporter [Arthrobacter sp. StoSoilB5]|uniref:MFS transporter n=1 Tax=Arthrobacter sp. StoSoilB5 TaxID=2830992 RepID=UPI001CC6B3C6|nr:MFS transporter [Arthrobacter sp. StoSoilB5]BCW44924.1 MFS transporter [Arthrobacter sp. StoSoilB5]